SRGRSSSCACGSARRVRDGPCAAVVAVLAGASEGDVVVGGGAEVGALGLGAARHELRLLAAALAVLAAAEELDRVGDDLHGLALGAVLGFPLAPVEAAIDADRPALGEVLRAALALVAPDGDVEVVRLVAPLARRGVLLPRVHGEAQLADGRSARRVAKLGVPGQVSDEDDAVDVGHSSLSSQAISSG